MTRRALLLACALFAGAGCGNGPEAKTAAAVEPAIDEDPVALLPGAVVVAAAFDARALYDDGTVGGTLGKMSEQYVPVGPEAGFVASRDVDKVWLGVYSTQGADAAAVLRGRFDAKKIREVADSKAATRGGAPLVAAPYAGYTVYTVSNVGFVVLTERTALVGTDAGMRRVLDRLKDKRVRRDVAPWMVTLLDQVGSGAAVAVAMDLETNPAAATGVAQVPLPMLRGLRKGSLVGKLEGQTMAVSGTLGYGDPQQAQTGAGGVRSVAGIVNMLAITGVAPKISGLDATAAGNDVAYRCTVDEQSLRGALVNVPRALGR